MQSHDHVRFLDATFFGASTTLLANNGLIRIVTILIILNMLADSIDQKYIEQLDLTYSQIYNK